MEILFEEMGAPTYLAALLENLDVETSAKVKRTWRTVKMVW